MIDEMTPPASFSSLPPLLRWWAALPELWRDALRFRVHCEAYGDVVKLSIDPAISGYPLISK